MNGETVCVDVADDAGVDDQGQRQENSADSDGGMPSWGEWRRSRAAWWRGHVEARRASGESRTAYCRRQGLNPAGLYHWERKLDPATGGGRGVTRSASPDGGNVPGAAWPTFSLMGETSAADGGVRFLPMGMLPMALGGGGLTLWVGPARIEVADGFDGELLRRVVQALEGR